MSSGVNLAEKALPDKGWDGVMLVSSMYSPLPLDFRDRPFFSRQWANLMVLLHRRLVKQECCESFRTGTYACKGCATVYDKQSTRWLYRFIARHAKLRPPKNIVPPMPPV